MKKIFLALFILASTAKIDGQTFPGFSRVYRSIPDTNIQSYGSISSLLFDSVQNALYFSLSANDQNSDLAFHYSKLYKTDINGVEMATYYDSLQSFDINYTASTNDGNYIYWFGSKMHQWNTSLSRLKVLKTDMSLNKIWEREYALNENDWQQILIGKDGNLLLLSSGKTNIQLYKTDSAGTVLYSDTNFASDAPILGAVASDDSSYIFCDWLNIRGYNANLQPQWSHSSFSLEGGATIVKSKEQPHIFYISGGDYTAVPAQIDGGYINGSIQKITGSGNESASKTYYKYTGSSTVYTQLKDGYQSICGANYNGCAAVGSTGLYKQIGEINRVDSNLNPIWDNGYTYTLEEPSSLSQIVGLPDGSFVAAGWTMAPNPSGTLEQQGWLLRVDSSGCYNDSCTGIVEPEVVNISTIRSNQFKMFPNPVNDILDITLQQPFSSETYIGISDASGRNMKQIIIPKGSLTYKIDVHNWISGLYIVTIQQQGNCYNQKITVQH